MSVDKLRDFELPDVDETIPEDAWGTGMGREAYLASARWQFQRIRLAMAAAEKETFSNILDMGCAHGRVMRVLKAAFPDASLTACDVDKPGVDFCAAQFGARPLYSTEDPNDLEIPEPFDLIWCCSVLTHFNQDRWGHFLRFFESNLLPGGIVVFTVHGRFIADCIKNRAGVAKRLTDERAEELLRGYNNGGFGYSARYDDNGLAGEWSLTKPSAVCARLEEHAPKLDLLTYTAGGWARRWGGWIEPLAFRDQDVVSCVRAKR